MLGTIVNVIAVIIGGGLGLLFKKNIKSEITDGIMKAEGIAVLIIGLNGVLTNMLYVAEDGKIAEKGGLILLISLALGAFIGEILKLDDKLNGVGLWAEKKIKTEGFAKGFVSAFLIFCVGSMSIIGALNDGLYGDSSVLMVKGTLDFITAMALASAMGVGVIFACVPLLAYQGLISAFAFLIKPLTENFPEMMTQFSMVGYAIIVCIGINFIAGQKIKTANLLPAMLIPVLYNLFITVEKLW